MGIGEGMRVLDIRVLQEFVVLSKHLKLTSAARELYTSAPTLSQHIASLEQEIGLTLFDRKGGLKLTRDGEKALAITQKLLHKYEELCALSIKKHESLKWRIPNYSVGLKEFLLAKPLFLEKCPTPPPMSKLKPTNSRRAILSPS